MPRSLDPWLVAIFVAQPELTRHIPEVVGLEEMKSVIPFSVAIKSSCSIKVSSGA